MHVFGAAISGDCGQRFSLLNFASFLWLAPSCVETEKCNRVELKLLVQAIFNYIYPICGGIVRRNLDTPALNISTMDLK